LIKKQYHWSLAGTDQYPLFLPIAVIGLFHFQKTASFQDLQGSCLSFPGSEVIPKVALSRGPSFLLIWISGTLKWRKAWQGDYEEILPLGRVTDREMAL